MKVTWLERTKRCLRHPRLYSPHKWWNGTSWSKQYDYSKRKMSVIAGAREFNSWSECLVAMLHPSNWHCDVPIWPFKTDYYIFPIRGFKKWFIKITHP